MSNLIKTNNSQAVLIPHSLIKKAGLEDANIEFSVLKNGLLLAKAKARASWDDKNLQKLAKKHEKAERKITQEFDEIDEEWDF